MKKLYIGIDFQNDFISGTMTVRGAKTAVNNFCKLLTNEKDEYSIILSMDWHTSNHVSFKENGGNWPIHCIQYENGSRIYSKLLKSSLGKTKNYLAIQKGDNPVIEEYGFMDAVNRKFGDLYKSVYNKLNSADVIYIGGIAGDYCVLESLKQLKKYWNKIIVLTDCIASIDKGKKLNDFCLSNNINMLTLKNGKIRRS